MITGLILAGGRALRMGGADKGLQSFHGTPMITHVIRRFMPQVGELAINTNQNLDAYRNFGLPVWPDEMGEFPGPLAGLQTGLIHCCTPYLATVPCDSPFLPLDLVARLKNGLEAGGANAAFAVTGEHRARQPQPVFCLLKTTLLPDLTQYLQNGGRKTEAWLAALHAVKVHFTDEDAFRNINTLEELQKLEAS